MAIFLKHHVNTPRLLPSVASFSFSSSSYSTTSPPSSDQPDPIATVTSILTHHRSKSRWSNILTLFPSGFTPSQFSQITLQLKNNPHLALRFFLFTEQKSLCNHNLSSYSTIIHILSRARLKTRARELIRVAIRTPGLLEKVEEVWSEMESLGCAANGYSYSILMAALCEEGKVREAEELWEEMRVKGLEPDIVAYNTMIGGFCKHGEIIRAEELYREMGLIGIQATCVTYENLIDGYCKVADIYSAMLIYKDMCRKGFKPQGLTVEALVRGLCDKRRVLEALETMRVAVRELGVYLSGKSYVLLIKGLCEEKKMEEALKLQAEMVGKGFKPDPEIYEAFIDGYLRQGNKEMETMLRKEVIETQKEQEKN
ncbi:pentatricopeptide repeat-containing protein At2g15980 isoform X3 [Herrania umbratica]|uniref:Pentatricopeptide repeat-containing protein At2g15980 isoform X3 n=1 Tax=Herrania umbratica TaxID=108875 RepID=A0A6J1BLH9_9ROSI|nr:pentatricopeptide repeat-containing protein At2g15980 isoform X3 [Herrania umbratica]